MLRRRRETSAGGVAKVPEASPKTRDFEYFRAETECDASDTVREASPPCDASDKVPKASLGETPRRVLHPADGRAAAGQCNALRTARQCATPLTGCRRRRSRTCDNFRERPVRRL
ncbi:Hypothetical predicted protein [Cloeon dipterum]|uniref:Uncharacterized protein n=1 Tax=Cloeon dipterum TaxID=197152 RepID=A0A8S1E436_9INSE|nr:Hypothetical predicted protein [Cloeon dipterum]CAB3388565.1 Hypothetical predicted protein [Cloeon dipterum]CAB3388570.1 Hypothetical predicted protein [Cloeon dipterum]CAB3388900.1 Hypothetical predicted protein [Cloeon dipterum]